MIFFCVGVMYLGEYDVCDVTLSVYKLFARCGYTLRVTSQTSYRIYILIHIYTYMQIIIHITLCYHTNIGNCKFV